MFKKCCKTDVLRVLLIYLHSPSGAMCPRDRAYLLAKPLATVLQPINAATITTVHITLCSNWCNHKL